MSQNMGENVRAKLQEARTRVQERVGVLKARRGAGTSGFLGSSNPGTIRERIEKYAPKLASIRREGIRSLPILQRRSLMSNDKPESRAAPPTPTPTIYPAAARPPERTDLTTKSRLY